MWVQCCAELKGHPKVYRLMARLGLPMDVCIGKLALLWIFAVKYAPDGNIGRHEPGAVATEMLHEGNAAELIEALLEAGFLDRTPEGLFLHDWMEYSGRLHARRESDKERLRQYRKNKKGECAEGDCVKDTCVGDANAAVGVTVQHSTEQHSTKQENTLESEASVYLPLANGKGYEVSGELAAQLSERYPEADIANELCRMKDWLEINKDKRKRREDMHKFICGWLLREKNRPKSTARAGTARAGRARASPAARLIDERRPDLDALITVLGKD